jgi:VCBS repeat protein
MNHPLILAALTTLAAAAPLAQAQSFPIVPLTDPTYPYTDPAFEGFDWEYPQSGTLQRLGDLNNDGIDDLLLVFLNSDINQIATDRGFWLFPGNEQGRFDQPYPLNIVIQSPNLRDISDVVIHDHDQDGLNDIIISSFRFSNQKIQALINNGEEFIEGDVFDINVYSSFISYTDIDLDGDDDLILYSGYLSLPDLIIFLSDGKGNYSLSQSFTPRIENDGRYSEGSIAFSDFEADGDLDILISNGLNQLLIENTPKGFLPPTPWEMTATNFGKANYRYTTLADVNGDGLTDLVMTGESDQIPALGFFLAPFTNGESREIPFTEFPNSENYSGGRFLFNPTSPGDLDGDGTDDLIAVRKYTDNTVNVKSTWRITDPLNQNGRLSISSTSRIHGDGNFNAYDPDQNPMFDDINFQKIYTDINNDGVLDLITPTIVRDYVDLDLDNTTRDHHAIMLWATLGNPFMPDAVLNEQETIYARATTHLTHADLDYDGEPEIITTEQQFGIKTIRRNDEDLWDYAWNPGHTQFRDTNAGFRTIATQLDTDSRTELVSLKIASSNEGVIPTIFLNVEIPGFKEIYLPDSLNYNTDFMQMLTDLGIQFQSQSSSFDIGDIDSDGDNDIIIRGELDPLDGPNQESVLVWLNDGEANFTPGPISPIEPYININVHTIALLDHDQDGDLELISIEAPADTSPTIAIYENDGSGNFTPTIQIPIHAYTNPQLSQYWIEVSDLDLDGFDDVQVLMTDNNQSEIVILYGSPTGLSTTPVYLAGKGAAEVHAADLDNNGLPDLYTCNYRSTERFKNSLTIMFQTAPRVFSLAISIDDDDFSAVDALDMNRDGGLDLIAGSASGSNQRDTRIFHSLPAPCPADFNLDRTLNFFDIELFIRLFTERRPIADFNNDSRYNFFDISAFLTAFNTDCP